MDDRRLPGRSWLPAALAALLLGGCSGTPFGDRLARSFSAAPAPATRPAEPTPAPTTPTGAAAGNQPQAADQANKQATSPAQQPPQKAAAKPRAAVITPAPYRITIKLPSADPSAPAELVTEALRQAGVPFEVEMIERVNATTGTPTPTPAPAPRPR